MGTNNIDDVIQQIKSLFTHFGNNSYSFTVDYDEETDGLYCNYAPYPNDDGYSVSGDLLTITETSQSDLMKLRDWLQQNGIQSRTGCGWDYIWGWREQK